MKDEARRIIIFRNRNPIYWITTLLVTSELILGGAWDILQTPYVRGVIQGLGYPLYLLVIIGVWKLLGAVTLLIPRFPRLKEWAYAGAFFNYSGAVVSHLIVGNGAGELVYLIIQICLLAVSWALRPPTRRAIVSHPLRKIS